MDEPHAAALLDALLYEKLAPHEQMIVRVLKERELGPDVIRLTCPVRWLGGDPIHLYVFGSDVCLCGERRHELRRPL